MGGSVQDLMWRGRDTQLLVLVALFIVTEVTRRGVKAHPRGGDPLHPNKDVKTYPGEKDDR